MACCGEGSCFGSIKATLRRLVSAGFKHKRNSVPAEAQRREVLAAKCEESGLDCTLWSQLPEEVVERIVAWLPLRDFFRLRGVCKRWNALVACPHFQDVQAFGPPRRHWLLLCKTGSLEDCLAYDVESMKWHKWSLSFLPLGLCVVKASGGLLLCFSTTMEKSVFICNPLTKFWVELPGIRSARFFRAVGMVVNSNRKAYKVVVVGCNGTDFNSWATEVYDSTSHSWTLAAQLPRGVLLYPGKMTLCNDLLYCITSHPFNVAVYDLEQGKWDQIDMPMYQFYVYPWLVSCGGFLLMVGCLDHGGARQIIQIWQLERQFMEWREVANMPQALYQEFVSKSPQGQFDCVGVDNCILICASQTLQVLCYDVSKAKWSWLRSCPHALNSHREEAIVGFDFDPGLTAQF
ncbi:hypothetical protein O6H91_15G031800 [Diphasiastrum complanatum]|uniref:Uncharacterized protein n=4 Tax=Diphasiastrum complanatum TaxID=34168 RepID=A0ACC2BHV1_DIPCM|nr:hypothetical protein O6H91_15G031500 [Diphasiastrum complanatum]KAJ7529033.1 hypothetical protein O6H91_15G031500 [Diphasiastrum complanatum]KAJ7529043.1 hypothetical protein O6H91_15G031800 [Diphasiastrum complanatum]KAJ7529044.1 hypothetical protein O6H91_15G031800 [Diphasiastrum complanatum]